jgi:hypothetical protein
MISPKTGLCGLLAFFVCACGGAAPTPELEISPALAEQITTSMAPFGAYEVEGGEGPDGSWYEVEAVSPVSIYFAADGTIPKFEVNVPLALLPEPVRTAASAEMELGDTLSEVELVYMNAMILWEVEIITADGTERDLYYLADGTLDHEDE